MTVTARQAATRAATSCPTCATAGRPGYCAPNRCYCAHQACPAHASWTPLPTPNLSTTATTPTPSGDAWANREESTWIDQL